MLTRKQIIANIEAIDAEIDTLQASKRETYDDHRHNLVAVDGKEVAKAEIEGLKKAVQRRRLVAKHGVEAVEQKDDLVEEILAEISAARAPRATRVENTHEFSPPAQTVPSVVAERQPDNTEIAPSAGGLAEEASNSSAPIQPETADETHGSSSINDEASPEAGPQAEASPAGTGTGTPADREERIDGEAASADLPTLSLGSAAAKSGEAGGVSPSTSPAPTKLKMNAEFFDEPHPACQRGEFCGGNSRLGLCLDCQAAVSGDHGEARVLN